VGSNLTDAKDAIDFVKKLVADLRAEIVAAYRVMQIIYLKIFYQLNILIKLLSMVSVVFAGLIVQSAPQIFQTPALSCRARLR